MRKELFFEIGASSPILSVLFYKGKGSAYLPFYGINCSCFGSRQSHYIVMATMELRDHLGSGFKLVLGLKVYVAGL